LTEDSIFVDVGAGDGQITDVIAKTVNFKTKPLIIEPVSNMIKIARSRNSCATLQATLKEIADGLA
jgi:ubiquinone/menaquinone biosynthesis C-methylase UbiE